MMVMILVVVVVVVSSMVHGSHKREWTVVIHRNPLDWPQGVWWWHIKQWNSIVYVIQGSISSGSTCCINTSTSVVVVVVVVVKMMEMVLALIIRVVWCWYWCFRSEISSKREFCVGLLRHSSSSWREITFMGFIIGIQGRDGWGAYVKRKIRSSSGWGGLNENPLQGHLLYGIWLDAYKIYILWNSFSFSFLFFLY